MMADIYSHISFPVRRPPKPLRNTTAHQQCNRAIEAWKQETSDRLGRYAGRQSESRTPARRGPTRSDNPGSEQASGRAPAEITCCCRPFTRLDALSKKVNAPRSSGAGAGKPVADANGRRRLVGHIKPAAGRFVCERQKNKRWKGHDRNAGLVKASGRSRRLTDQHFCHAPFQRLFFCRSAYKSSCSRDVTDKLRVPFASADTVSLRQPRSFAVRSPSLTERRGAWKVGNNSDFCWSSS